MLSWQARGAVMSEGNIKKLSELPATAICGNDITSSVLYVSALTVIASGQYAWISLLIVAAVLFLFREAGQADLFLISWLGIDLHNRGERAYRLLGCQLTYHGDLPAPHETLQYDIRVDGHAHHDQVRLFFFHYDCRVGDDLRLSVREGQAGFFNEDDLRQSAGVLWSAETAEPRPDARLDDPLVHCTRASLDGEQVLAFSEGRAFDCFGAGFERARTHVHGPRIQGGRMLLLEQVPEVSRDGGPWRRGYLKATTPVHPDDWYFEGHFKNDPCMPGTLMFEGCLQAMALYMGFLGYTLPRDGWRFQPVPEQPIDLRCRGQVDPSSRLIVYEVFVEEVVAGPVPTLTADLLCTCDGLKALHARRVGLQLVPDWPLNHHPELLTRHVERGPVASRDGFRFDHASLLASALGPPSHAFGPMYRAFDGPRRVARLPGPPYHFMSRVHHIEGEMGGMRAGTVVWLEYDIPATAWYFEQNSAPAMPFCVLLEAALQPCGWLASFVGSALTSSEDLSFRNLDGTGTVLAALEPGCGTLRTRVEITSINRSGGMIIEAFQVECRLGERRIFSLDTVFGFFPAVALARQVGLPTSDQQQALLTRPSDLQVDLARRPPRYCAGQVRLAGPMLLMLDRVTGFWPRAGAAGLGMLRAEKDVDAGEWFFKAHFFQDPVQPGSLGLEAMVQLLQFYLLHTAPSLPPDMEFEALESGQPLTWRYRGQVLPEDHLITTTMEITAREADEQGYRAVADASLWVDGKRIYEVSGLAVALRRR